MTERSDPTATPAATSSDPFAWSKRIGQIALTVNGQCCPKEIAASSSFPFVQRTFELVGGPATGVPGVEQLPDLASIFRRTHEWLDEVEDKLAQQLNKQNGETPDAPEVTGAARSGAFRPDS